ncbi:MAG: ATP-binding cassette domain-containing protein [Clostridiales bacterium]|mgnify:FL=1|uniref:ATP-binding cassette domain-containing protein n=1 Tax=Candidatus Egerieisoma faecipullorum TaxID=2840963 RepID=A0A9D1IA68_9CLOT|nr:ATP-binding cassette domain-containing protein [Clostridiales bacterium]PWM20933.1 MAG: ABC transporter [Clostridiales bacterium]HIU30063.1 ATP-binding cassette domain-containing protein [Candidatus Egerieisoma faecipullorum]
MIEIKNLTKRYGQIRAVDDISLTIKKGEILGFLGPNGAGKSTTMNILTGYISATSGSVSVGGYDIMDSPREAKRLIGYLPEQPPLYYDMTVNEYLRFICDLKSVPLKQRRRQLDEILYLVKIGDMRDRLIKNLSKGYKQRVGVAQALVGNPQVLVLDEPTVGLDPKQIIEIRKLIGALRHEHTIILSTHILQEVNAVCSTVAVINKGKLAASGSVSDFTAAEGTVSKFMISVVGGSGKSEIQKVLQNVDGVRRVDFVRVDKDAFIFNVESEKKSDVRRGVFNALAHANMAEIELRPVGRTLEEIFIDIVSKEQVPAAE